MHCPFLPPVASQHSFCHMNHQLQGRLLPKVLLQMNLQLPQAMIKRAGQSPFLGPGRRPCAV